MRHILLVLMLALPMVSFAKDKKARGRAPASEFGNVKPSSIVTDDDQLIGDDFDDAGERASAQPINCADHPISSAVGHIYGSGEARCSSTVIRPPKCSDPSKAKAHVITNGHCTMKARDFTAKFGVCRDIPENRRRELGLKVLYSTQNRDDIAIMELDQTVAQLESNFGVKPVSLAQSYSAAETYRNYAIPLNKIDKDSDKIMRLNQACKEAGRTTFVDMFRFYTSAINFSSCSAVGGSSGSGLFNSKDELAAIMFGGMLAEGPKPPNHECELDSCSYDGDGMPERKQGNFGLDVTFLNECYEDCTLNLNLPGCRLPNPENAIGTGFINRNVNWTSTLETSIGFTSKKFSKVKVKMCTEAKTCSCQDPAGYVDRKGKPAGQFEGNWQHGVKPSDYAPPGTKLVAKEGEPATFQFLCIIGVNGDGSMAPMKDALNFPLYLHRKPGPKIPGVGGG